MGAAAGQNLKNWTGSRGSEPEHLSNSYRTFCGISKVFFRGIYDIMTLFKAGNGRMAIHTVNAKHLWYNDLIQSRKRPNGHSYRKCEAFMV